MIATPEQLTCIATASNNRRTKINAVAGAGKTSTLVLIAKQLVQPSLYLAFNKVTASEAAVKFPSHVECRTTHSIAYGEFGRDMHHKLSRPRGRYVNVAGTGGEIAKMYKIEAVITPDGRTISASYLGLMIKSSVAKFEQSGDSLLSDTHLPWYDLKELEKNYGVHIGAIKKDILKYAKSLWKDRTNLSNIVLASHDTYLKLWQLSKPQLNTQVIYLDESQDTTPCVLDVVLNQQEAKLILVGDNRQNIYGWRGSINAMNLVEAAECSLSKSFRYGQSVADVASYVLGNAVNIEGREDINSVVGKNVVDVDKPYTMLCRTNAYLLDEAVSDIDQGKSVSIEIDVKDFVKVLESSLALYREDSKNVKHERVIPYSTFKDMQEEAKDGGEFGRIIKIIKQGRAEKMIELLMSYSNPTHPHVTYTTAHKCKGREFSQVVLGADFPSHYAKKGEWVGLDEAEQNLLYVAVTRAIDVLEVNESVTEAIDHYKPLSTLPETALQAA